MQTLSVRLLATSLAMLKRKPTNGQCTFEWLLGFEIVTGSPYPQAPYPLDLCMMLNVEHSLARLCSEYPLGGAVVFKTVNATAPPCAHSIRTPSPVLLAVSGAFQQLSSSAEMVKF